MRCRGLTDEDDLWNEVEELQREYGSSVIAVPDDNGELYLLYWQSPFMKQMYRTYPSLIFMDGTYKINNRNMPLYSLLVVDGDGKGQVVAYAVVRDETVRSLSTMLDIFKQNNATAVESLQLVLVDKDYSEITAIDNIFNNAHIILCKLHVLDAFRRSFKGHALNTEKHDSLRDLLHTMVHTHTESAYNEAKDQIAGISDTYAQYFDQHWHPVRHMWAGHKVCKLPHLGFTTNNAVESHNAKIKTLLSHHSKMADVVRNLCLLETTKIKERNIHVRRTMATRLRVTNSHGRSSYEDVYRTATMHAARLTVAQLKQAQNQFTVQPTGNEQHVVQFERGHPHTVEKCMSCDCSHFMTTGLPCAHIFAARCHEGHEEFNADMLPDRWRKQVYVASLHDLDSTQAGDVDMSAPVAYRRPQSVQEKFREASITTDALANVVASVGGSEYDEKLSKLKLLLSLWQNGRDVAMEEIQLEGIAANGLMSDVIVIAPVMDAQLDEAQSETDSGEVHLEDTPAHITEEEVHVEGVEASSHVAHEAELEAHSGEVALEDTPTHNTQEVTAVVDVHWKGIKLPKAIKVRGRPKGGGQTVIGAKRKRLPSTKNISATPTLQVVDTQQNDHDYCGAHKDISDSGEIGCGMEPVCDTHVVNTVVDLNGNSIAAPKIKRARGRPKGSGSGKSQLAVSRKAKCFKPGECSTVTDSHVNDAICYICYSDEPPRAVCVDEIIVWRDCERNCGRWFHRCCVGDSNVPYACAWCQV